MTWSIYDDDHACEGYGINCIRTNNERTGQIYAISHKSNPRVQIAQVEITYDRFVGSGAYAVSQNATRAFLKHWVEQNR